MGIQRLKTFVEENNLVFNHSIHDCSVLIDGSNLIHQLHTEGDLTNDMFGGNYIALMQDITRIIKVFKACNIQAIAVLDGSIDFDRQKLPTKLKRSQEQIGRAISIFNQIYDDQCKLFPLLSTDLFEMILRREGMRVYKSTFEADRTIVQLARDLNIPVLSDDSDFLLQNIPAGVISTRAFLQSIYEFETDSNKQKSKLLKCCIYKIGHLVTRYQSKNVDLIVMAACFLSKEIGGAPCMEQAIKRLPTQTSQTKYRCVQIDKVLKFVSKFDTLAQMLLELKNLKMPPMQLEHIETCMLAIHEQSKLLATQKTKDLDQYFSVNFDVLFNLTSLKIPKWLVRAHVQKAINKRLLSIANLGLDMLRPLVENINLASAYDCTSKLSELMYGILLKDSHIQVVQRYCRFEQKLIKQEIKPASKIVSSSLPLGSMPLPSISEIEAMDSKGRWDLFFKMTGLDDKIVDEFVKSFREIKKTCAMLDDHDEEVLNWTVLALIALVFMCQSYKEDLPAVLVYSIYTNILLNGQYSQDVPRLFELEAHDRLAQLNRGSQVVRCTMSYNPATLVHYFSVYQVCFQTLGLLTAMLQLDEHFAFASMPFLLNGAFIYELSLKLDANQCPLAFLEAEVLGETFGPLPLFRAWLELVLKHSKRKILLRENSVPSPTKPAANVAEAKVDDMDELTADLRNLSFGPFLGVLVPLTKVVNRS